MTVNEMTYDDAYKIITMLIEIFVMYSCVISLLFGYILQWERLFYYFNASLTATIILFVTILYNGIKRTGAEYNKV